MKLNILSLLLLCGLSYAQSLPDNPKPQPEPTGFWHIRIADEPALKIHKREFFAEEGAMWAATLVDMKVGHPQSNNVPRGGEFYIDNLVPVVAATGFHFIASKFLGCPIALIPVGIITTLHVRAAVTGVYQ